MSQFSGRTLEELEADLSLAHGDPNLLGEMQSELLDRKQRREDSGKAEKTRARNLRSKIAGMLASMPVLVKESGVYSAVGPTSQTFPPALPTKTLDLGMRARPPQQARVLRQRTLEFTPTDEQLAAIDAFSSGENLKINAFAGSGKTSTLALLARNASGCGIYAAFNRACVTDSKSKFGSNVQCKTLHSIAFQAMRSQFRNDKLAGKLNTNVVLSHIDVAEFEMNGLRLHEKQLVSLALATFRRFAQSRAKSIREIDIPVYGIVAKISPDVLEVLSEVVYGIAELVWQLMRDKKSSLPLGHDGYLKLWALEEPRLGVDFILLDEAQDTNEVILGLLEKQVCQLVYVGDRHQQIYEWRGAVNALDKVHATSECQLTKSFRFGAEIAEVANAALLLLREKTRITGNDSVLSTVGSVVQPETIIARSNATVLSAVIACLGNGDIPYVEGGTDELKKLIRGVYDLRDKGFSSVPEFFGFSSWEEVVEYSETEYGQELAAFVQMVQSFGLGRLWHILKNVADDPEHASVTISTTHKAKGREWGRVRLEDDFVLAQEDEEGNQKPIATEEIRILYVAATRAKYQLQLGNQSKSFLGLT